MPKTILLAVTLPAAPERLYDMYLDSESHAAFTGHPVTIMNRAEAEFRAFDSMLTGTILHVVPKTLIVQTWRSANWPEDATDSVLTLSFWPEDDGGRIELVHANVPDEDFAGVSQGWCTHYWNPWRKYLEQNT